MIRGWDRDQSAAIQAVIGSTSRVANDGDAKSAIFTGRVILERPEGSWGREIRLQSPSGEQQEEILVRVHLQAKTCPTMAPWITIRGARKLLCQGVTLRVTGDGAQDCCDDSGFLDVIATRLQIIGALPATPYLARLLSIDLETLGKLFCCSDTSEALLALAYALQPCTLKRCERLHKLCQEEKKAGRFGTFFKQKELLLLCEEIRQFQGWSRGPQAVPKTSSGTWSALLRMEQRWCQEVEYGQVAKERTVISAKLPENDAHHVVYGGIDVDPSHNLPDPNDERRIRYIDERKRPQVLWMLGLIRRLVGCAEEDLSEEAPAKKQRHELRELNFVDIGGGRGDLANAVAAFFAQPHVRVKAHVTVIDINQSSLNAGRERALKAKLDGKMSFVLCDVANRENVEDLCANQRCDLVFGLHCCGGLAEAAVELAVQANASFCVSTCCFRSNRNLASLSKHADSMFESDVATGNVAKQNQSDRDMVSALAVVASGQGQHRAIRTLNSMRLMAAEDRFKTTGVNNTTILKTWQESFPIEYSVQNKIMVGKIKDIT